MSPRSFQININNINKILQNEVNLNDTNNTTLQQNTSDLLLKQRGYGSKKGGYHLIVPLPCSSSSANSSIDNSPTRVKF